jgi:hypothetical protein
MGRRLAAEPKGGGASLHHEKRGCFTAPRKVSASRTWVAGELNRSLSRIQMGIWSMGNDDVGLIIQSTKAACHPHRQIPHGVTPTDKFFTDTYT